MTYSLSLKTVGLIVGIFLIVFNTYLIVQKTTAIKLLTQFLRFNVVGNILVIIAAIWSFFLLNNAHLGEFSHLKKPGLILIPFITIFLILKANEFLSVRSLGFLLLLVACPILDSAYFKPQVSRLLLPILAYIWIVLGLFFVGMPYLARDIINFLSIGNRWVIIHSLKVIYGIVLTWFAFIYY